MDLFGHPFESEAGIVADERRVEHFDARVHLFFRGHLVVAAKERGCFFEAAQAHRGQKVGLASDFDLGSRYQWHVMFPFQSHLAYASAQPRSG
jgi:hypothetical protein